MKDRPIIRCRHCQLRQFVTMNGNCRKCGNPLYWRIGVPAETPNQQEQPQALTHKAGWGRMLETLRKERELSQCQLAQRCGMGRTFISRLENRIKVPTAKTATRLALALDLPFYVLYGTDIGQSYYYNNFLFDDSFVEKLSHFTHKLNAEQRRIVLDAVRSLAMHSQLSFVDWEEVRAMSMRTISR